VKIKYVEIDSKVHEILHNRRLYVAYISVSFFAIPAYSEHKDLIFQLFPVGIGYFLLNIFFLF
jgi:hypothetical protein